ncbi:MAG: recombinase family protein [Pseudonocardiaceae bacterium]
MTESPRRAAIYVRISRDKVGVERQEADCRELAGRLGWTVAEVFADNDLSAYSGKRRPRYCAMLEAVRAGRVEAVLAWHTDRLHRSPVELEDYITACNESRDVPTHTVQAGPLDLSTPSGRMVARQLGAVARYESEHRSERVRRAFPNRLSGSADQVVGVLGARCRVRHRLWSPHARSGSGVAASAACLRAA